jgi:predicted glycoside hydrolase/deacetylase ChbG (UPF0249 family)
LSASKLLIVNADDFGFTSDVNEGIVEAHRHGILTATTLMATGAAFEHAVQLARENPGLDVGCHLVLTGGVSLLPPRRALPATVPELALAVALGRVRVYDEMVEQVQRILDAGLVPTHIDAHKHVHMLPPVMEAMARVAERFRIRWVRRPLGIPVVGPCLGLLLTRRGCRMTDYFTGFRLTGRLDTQALVDLIRRLPEGSTELMCHPGYARAELRAARTRLKASRELELEALKAPETRQAIQDSGTRLVNYRALDAAAL